jgi:hypothetical protein
LVAYIHLNPLRAGIVDDLSALKAYPFTGHSALMGRKHRAWQDTGYVLALFGRGLSEARLNLQRHVAKWALKGRCPELTGGGLVRSSGGWHAVKEKRTGMGFGLPATSASSGVANLVNGGSQKPRSDRINRINRIVPLSG